MNRCRQTEIHETLRTDDGRSCTFERTMPNSGTSAKARTYSGTFSASEKQSKSATHGSANCGIFSGPPTLTGSTNPNNTALNVVISDADQLNSQTAPSLDFASGIHAHEPYVHRGSLSHNGSVADHDRRTYGPAKYLTRLVKVGANAVGHNHGNHCSGRDRQYSLIPA